MVLAPILGAADGHWTSCHQSVDDSSELSPAQTESPPGWETVRREQLDKVSGLSAQTSVSQEPANGNSQKELKCLRVSSEESEGVHCLRTPRIPNVAC